MLTSVENKLFRPNAIFIPTKGGKEGRDFDREDCTLLFVDGEYAYGEVYTEDAWKNGGEPAYIQRRGDFFLPDDSEIRKGRVQLLPDVCIVKVPEREYWCEEVQAMTKRMFGVYALDRRQHFHLCELCASYELWFVETQYEENGGGCRRRRPAGRAFPSRHGFPRGAGDLRSTGKTSTPCSCVTVVAVPVSSPRAIRAADTGCAV